ncbi:MAG: DUF3187 family protein [Planctomycetota bacterium]
MLFRSLACALVLPACAILPEHTSDPAPKTRGPLPTRANAPVSLMFLQFKPRTAHVQPLGTFGLQATSAYSSIFEDGSDTDSEIVFDGEIWRSALAVRYGVTESSDLEVEIPLVYASSGFLDQFVETFHEILFLPNSGRESRPKFTYSMEARQNGERFYHMEGNSLGLGDMSLIFAQRVLQESVEAPGVLVRAGVELPTGSESAGFGNGEVDWGGDARIERSFGRWTLGAAASYVLTAEPSAFTESGVDASDIAGAQAGVEYRWNDDLSFVFGAVYTSTVTDDIHIEELNSDILMLDFGAIWDTHSGSRWMAAFQEDAIAASGPDFTVFVGLSFGM